MKRTEKVRGRESDENEEQAQERIKKQEKLEGNKGRVTKWNLGVHHLPSSKFQGISKFKVLSHSRVAMGS